MNQVDMRWEMAAAADASGLAEVAKGAVTRVFMDATLGLRAEVGAKPISMHLAIYLIRSLF
jgi:hypothetical protein